MASPYTPVDIASYNPNPPPDDGTQVPENEAHYSDIKTKLADPIKTLAEAIDDATETAFGKIIGGAGITSTAISYEVLAADQGKLIKATVAGVTITTPDATAVSSPFVFAILNNSDGNITIEGNGSQTIDGAANVTLATTRGMFLFTDGANWFTAGQNWQFDAPDRPSNLFNGSWVVSVAANALTIALKTKAGSDPSATDPVLVNFGEATITDGGINVRTITGALSLVISSGSSLGFANNEANLIHIGLIDNAGTPEIAASKDGSPWNEDRLVTSTTEGAGGGADTATTLYSTAGRSNVRCRLLGTILITTGATAGEWGNAPTRVTTVDFNPYRPFKNTNKAQASFVTTTTTALRDGFNISSLADGGTGDTDITFAVAMAHAFPAVGVYGAGGTAAIMLISTAEAPTASTLNTRTASVTPAAADCDFVSVIVAGH